MLFVLLCLLYARKDIIIEVLSVRKFFLPVKVSVTHSSWKFRSCKMNELQLCQTTDNRFTKFHANSLLVAKTCQEHNHYNIINSR